MADSIKVPKEEFEAVIKSLLKMRPLPLAETPRKRGPNAKKSPASPAKNP